MNDRPTTSRFLLAAVPRMPAASGRGWRAWQHSPALRRQRAELRALRSAPLRLAAPELGSTLRHPRSLQDGGTP